MDRKKLVLLVAAGILAIVTGLVAKSMFTGGRTAPQAAAAPVPTGPKVLVAQRGLPIGTIITPDAIGYQPWPKDMVDNAYFVEGESDLNKMLGTVVRQSVTAGEPITRGALVAPGDRGFLAAALGPGMRAITIPVSAKTGVGGFVFPGDHVDLMLTQSISGDGPALKVAETIVRNVRVLATDRSAESETTPDGKTKVRAFRTVTLEVTPKIAEKVTVAQTVGRLSLTLRSIADNQADLDKAIASGELNIPAGASKDQEDAILRATDTRPQDGATSFATGGDVSRFQRRTVPPRNEGNAPPPSLGAGGGAPSVKVGPIVRVTRGSHTDAVSTGDGDALGQSAHSLLGNVSRGMRDVGKTMPSAMVAP
jgi:pilus assembly protein CpaB